MTQTEIEQEKQRAVILAASIGGALAVLLGSRPGNVTWDPTTASFRIDGRRVAASTIRRELQRIEAGFGVRVGKLTDRLFRKEIDLDGWRTGFKELIGSSHILMAALGSGSIVAAAETPQVQRSIESERRYADNFADNLEKKEIKPQTVKARARSYMLTAAMTFAAVSLVARKFAGYTEARRIRTAAESCQGCRDHAYTWMPINEIPEIGSLQCRSRCRCYLEYR